MEIVKNYNLDIHILNENSKIFDNYVKSNFNFEEHGINLKYLHTLRVAKMSKEIGGKIGLDEELCYCLGLLHDYARFPQWKEFKSFVDLDTFDHADKAVALLFDEGEIKEFKVDEKDYFLLKMAIKFHNKIAIDETYIKEQFDLEEKNSHSFEEIIKYCKLIRDSDKMDLFNLIGFGVLKNLYTKDGVTDAVMESFNKRQLVPIEKMQTKLDRILCFVAFLFDLNYQEAVDQINLDNYFFAIDEFYGSKLNEPDRKLLRELIKDTRNYFNKN